jgi:ABC-2 type transport system ATP-binding protein
VLGVSPCSPEAGRLTVPLPRPDAALDALVDLRAADIAIAEMNVAKPSLDEVFLALTGHTTSSPDDTPTDDVEEG